MSIHKGSGDSLLMHCLGVENVFVDAFLDGYCSTVQGLLDWFEVGLGFSELSFVQTVD